MAVLRIDVAHRASRALDLMHLCLEFLVQIAIKVYGARPKRFSISLDVVGWLSENVCKEEPILGKSVVKREIMSLKLKKIEGKAKENRTNEEDSMEKIC